MENQRGHPLSVAGCEAGASKFAYPSKKIFIRVFIQRFNPELRVQSWTQHRFSGLWPQGPELPKWRVFLDGLHVFLDGHIWWWCWYWLAVGRCLPGAGAGWYRALVWPTNQVTIPWGQETQIGCQTLITLLLWLLFLLAFTLGWIVMRLVSWFLLTSLPAGLRCLPSVESPFSEAAPGTELWELIGCVAYYLVTKALVCLMLHCLCYLPPLHPPSLPFSRGF